MNPCGLYSKLAQTHSLPTEIIDLVLGPSLRFLMSHWGKNSVKDKVIGKKWIYLERNTLLTEFAISEASAALEAHSTDKNVGHSREQTRPQQVVWLVFMGQVIS